MMGTDAIVVYDINATGERVTVLNCVYDATMVKTTKGTGSTHLV